MTKTNQRIPEGWSVKKLGECFSFSAGGDVDKDCFSTIKDKEHPYPIYANALNNEGLYGYSSKYKIKAECITITGRGDIGNVCYRKGFFTPIVRLITAIPFKEIDAKFMSYLCSKIHFFNETTGVPQLTVPQVQGYKVVLPPLPEQEKIAEILGCWDDGIEKLSRLIEQKKLLKKGLMQRLLSGKQRLPGFSEPWKNIEFDQIALLNNRKYIPNRKEHLKCLELEHFEKETGRLIGYVDSAEQSSTKNIFKSGDVLFGKLRPYLKKFTKSAFNGVCSTEIWVLMAYNNCIDDFLYLLIQSTKFLNACNVSSGTHMPRADWNFVSHIPFFIPPLPEQKAIADILSKADEEIDLLTEKLSALKSQKKGLMQKLLTGQIRVKVA